MPTLVLYRLQGICVYRRQKFEPIRGGNLGSSAVLGKSANKVSLPLFKPETRSN